MTAVTKDDPHYVWIGDGTGEGGEFSKTAVNAVLREFYRKNL